MKDESCKARIDEMLKGRIEDLQHLYNPAADLDNKARDEADEERNQYGLCFDYVSPNTFKGRRRGYFRYQLSWGGPADEFRFFCDENVAPVRIEYWFMDWGDGAKKILSGKNEELLKTVFDNFKDCGCCEMATKA